ncbi:MAG: glycosyltransferase family 39 protein [Candidatus Promineifilaceae bacterium]
MIKRNITWLLVILLVAFVLRLAFLGSKSVWLDEAFSVWQANRTPAEIWNATFDNHPPMYYLLLQAWMNLGKSEAVIRLPSVLASMVGLALLYTLARRLFDRKVALVAVTLLALAPIDLWYAQEARMVIFVVPAALLIALGLLEMGWKGAGLITAGLAAGLYFDYTIVPLWVILSSIWFVSWWKDGRPAPQLMTWFLASLLAWLIFMPLWPHLHLVASRMSDIFIFANLQDITGLPGFGVWLPVIALLLLAVGTAAFAHWIPDILDRPGIGQIVVISSVIVFILLTALIPIPRLYSVKRLVVTGWPFVILGLAWLTLSMFRKQKLVFFGLVAFSLITSLITLLAVPKDDWRGAVALINQKAGADDVVWLYPFSGNLPYNYYEPTVSPRFSFELLDAPPETNIWHIAERQPNRPIPGSEAEIWLDANRKLLEVIPLYRLEVRHYSSTE